MLYKFAVLHFSNGTLTGIDFPEDEFVGSEVRKHETTELEAMRALGKKGYAFANRFVQEKRGNVQVRLLMQKSVKS